MSRPQTAERLISPLEGEMSPKATEGVAPHEAPTLIRRRRLHPVEPTPSGLPAISPSRGEITPFAPLPSSSLTPIHSHPRQATGARRP
ncbi:hypothetical protein FJ958_08415 [Mesorhizobium sp. B2-3-5]|nr:hypothetical protein FJ958_08415 [Mesorhizobium sp. B2-3-5]